MKSNVIVSIALISIGALLGTACSGEPGEPIDSSSDALECAGITGKPCPEGYTCEDDPSDNCIPGKGADCIGICVED